MPPDTKISDSTIEKMPDGEFQHPKLLLLTMLAAVLFLVTGAYWYFGSRSASAEMKTIGIPYVPQQNDAIIGFKQGMERLGYVEGKNVKYIMYKVIVGPTTFEELKAGIEQMVDQHVDLILATLEHAAKMALETTRERGDDTPVVFLTRFYDPVEYGLIESYRSSGNNLTGIATNMLEIIERNLEFFKEMNPNLKKLGVFTDGFMTPEIGSAYLAELRKRAPRVGIELVEFTTKAPPPEAEAEFNRIASTIKKGDIDGLFHIAGHYYVTQEIGESELAVRLGIPMSAPFEDLPNGGMFSFSDEFMHSGEQAAIMADKILKGAKPSDIPIEFGARSVLTLMMGRAREAGVQFTDSMLFIAENKFESGDDFPPIFHERD